MKIIKTSGKAPHRIRIDLRIEIPFSYVYSDGMPTNTLPVILTIISNHNAHLIEPFKNKPFGYIGSSVQASTATSLKQIDCQFFHM